MTMRRLRACAIVLGLLCVLTSRTAWHNLALSALVLPWVARTASGRRALNKRLHALVPLLLGVTLGLAVLAAISGEHGSVWFEHAYPLAARVIAATLLLTWLTHDLRAPELEAVLCWLRLPAPLIALIMETSAFGRQLSETLQAAWAACVLRGGAGSLRALRQTVGAVAGIVVLRSIDRSERVAIASALRAAGSAPATDVCAAHAGSRAANHEPHTDASTAHVTSRATGALQATDASTAPTGSHASLGSDRP